MGDMIMVGYDYTRALHAAAAAYDVAPHEIAGHRRTRRITQARWAFWDCLHRLGWPKYTMATEGGFDHSSVMHGLNRFAKTDLPRVTIAPILRFPHQARREAARIAQAAEQLEFRTSRGGK